MTIKPDIKVSAAPFPSAAAPNACELLALQALALIDAARRASAVEPRDADDEK